MNKTLFSNYFFVIFLVSYCLLIFAIGFTIVDIYLFKNPLLGKLIRAICGIIVIIIGSATFNFLSNIDKNKVLNRQRQATFLLFSGSLLLYITAFDTDIMNFIIGQSVILLGTFLSGLLLIICPEDKLFRKFMGIIMAIIAIISLYYVFMNYLLSLSLFFISCGFCLLAIAFSNNWFPLKYYYMITTIGGLTLVCGSIINLVNIDVYTNIDNIIFTVSILVLNLIFSLSDGYNLWMQIQRKFYV